VRTFHFSARARLDLLEILDYVSAASGAGRAEGVRVDLVHAAELLARHPYLGHLRRDLTSRAVLFWPVHSFMIVYRPASEPLEVIRIVSGWQDLACVLTERVEEAVAFNLVSDWREFAAA